MRTIFLLLSSIILVGCGGPKFGPRESAEVFFTLLKDGKTADAYDRAATSFKITRSQKYFEARVHDLGLDSIRSITLGNIDARGELMLVRGEFTLKEDEKLSLNLSFVEEDGTWKLADAKRDPDGEGIIEDVFAVEARSKDGAVEQSKSFTEPVATAMPTERQIEKLAKQSLKEFDAAVKAGNFSDLFNSVSNRWKYRGKDPNALTYTGFDDQRIKESDPLNKAGRLTVPALEATFGPFVAAKVDLSPIEKAAMKLSDPVRLNSDGVLSASGTFDCYVFQGAFPPQPRKMNFKLEYVFEGSDWKLFGITVNILPKEEDKK